jgi:GAF domain-containing protein
MADAPIDDDVACVARIEFVPTVLKLVCEYTGMRWSAVAHVTDESWTACAVRDGLGFGLPPGGQLEIDQTFCIDVKRHMRPIAMSHASRDPVYASNPLPARYGFESYRSTPIVLPSGRFFGRLCALDPQPRPVTDERTATIFEAFATLIGVHLEVEQQRDRAQATLLTHLRGQRGAG